MPDKKKNTEEAKQPKATAEGVSEPAAAKKPATRKKTTSSKTTATKTATPKTATPKTAAPSAEHTENTETAKKTTASRAKSAGTRKAPAQKTAEQAEKTTGTASRKKASTGTKTAAKKAAAPNPDAASEEVVTTPAPEVQVTLEQERNVMAEPAVQEPTAKEEPAVKEESVKEEPSTPHLLGAPNDKLPVKAQAQRGVEIAVPPVNFAALSEQRRNFWGRVFLLFSVGIILAVSVFIFLYRPTVYSARSHSIRFLYNADTDVTQVMYDGALCKQTLPGEWKHSAYDSTGSICAALVGDRLYLVKGNEIEEIAFLVQDFMLSQNGRTLVYRNQENQLCYVRLSGKPERYTVSRDCRDSRYCLSPDGEMLFYTYVEQKGVGESKTHAAIFSLSGLKPYFPKTTGITPVAISNDFEHIFYFDEVGDLYYMNEKSEISLCRRNDQGGMELLFDREFEEVLIKDAKGIMLWQNGEETMIPQLRGTESLVFLPNQRASYRQLPIGGQYLVNSFDKNYYLKKGSDAEGTRLAYLDGETLTEVAFLSEQESRPVVTDKGVYYLEYVTMSDDVRKHLYFCPSGKTAAVQLSWDVEDFCVNSDGSRILHVDHQGALYASRVASNRLDSVLISDFVDGALQDSSATDVFYYFVSEEMFASSNGEKPAQAMSSEIDGVFLDAHTAIFFDVQENSYTIYTRHRNRKNLVQIASGIVSFN